MPRKIENINDLNQLLTDVKEATRYVNNVSQAINVCDAQDLNKKAKPDEKSLPMSDRIRANLPGSCDVDISYALLRASELLDEFRRAIEGSMQQTRIQWPSSLSATDE